MMGALRQVWTVRTLLIASLLVVLSATPAAPYWISVYETSNHGVPLLHDPGGLITLDIVVDSWQPDMTTVSFLLDIPDCPELALVDVSYGSNLHLGSIETGVTVTFVGCKPLPHLVATLTFLSTGVSECCYFEIEPHPESTTGEVEGWDCSSNKVLLGTPAFAIAPAGSGNICGAPTVPANPSPPDGAVDQPLDVTLNWETSAPLGSGLCIFYQWLYLGTDPDPPIITPGDGTWPPHEIGPLQPSTTYYWKIRAYDCFWDEGTTGPIWQFTTADPVATETSTWGRIKALYR
jgi:hypothetical protein